MKIIKPLIFPKNIKAGVVTKNLDLFPEYGFSLSKTTYIDDEFINNCREKLANELDILPKQIIRQHQIHSDIINVVTDLNYYEDSDAIITNQKSFCLNVSIADCIAVLIYDTKNEVIAGVHSGWRGTELNIVGKTIFKMKDEFNSKTENLVVYISPSALCENYEVGKEFCTIFPKFVKEIEGKYSFDNRAAVIEQILSCGISKSNIEISELDTITNLELHSYRRDKEKAGRMSAYIMMT
jgi:YfiH family protein